MNFELLWTHPLSEALACSLLHTLWQGGLLAILLYVLLRNISADRFNLRYVLALTAMGLVVGSWLITLSIYHRGDAVVRGDTQATSDMREAPAGAGQLSPSPPVVKDSDNRPIAAHDSEPSQESAYDWTGWIMVGWLPGVVFMTVRMIARLAGARRLYRSGNVLPGDSNLVQEAERLRNRMHMRRKLRLLLHERIAGPVVIGLFRSTILLPASLAGGIPVDHLQAILAHELAHIRRYDYLVHCVQMLIEAVLFFNPAVWWINRQVRIEREACCDAVAAEMAGAPLQYARVLSAWAERVKGMAATAVVGSAFSGRQKEYSLLDRMQRLLLRGHRPALQLPWPSLLVMLLVGTMTLLALQQGAQVTVALAADILSPQERMDKLVQVAESHPVIESERVYGLESQISVSGRVRTIDGQPLPVDEGDIFIRTERESYGELNQVSISKDGRFRSGMMEFGQVWIMVSPKGSDYATKIVGPLEVELGGTLENIDIVLDHGFRSELHFVAPDGRGIANARIEGGYEYNSGGHINNIKRKSDQDGRIVFEHATHYPLKLDVRAPGYQYDEREISLKPNEPTVCKLQPATPVQGVVVDRDSGRPIAEARIRLINRQNIHIANYHMANAEVLTETDQAGRFTVDTLRDDCIYILAVTAENQGTRLLKNVRTGQPDIRVEMGPELYIRGKVVGDLDLLGTESGNKSLSYYETYDLSEYYSYRFRHSVPVEVRDGVGYFEILDFLPGEIVLEYPPLQKMELDATEPIDDVVIDLKAIDQSQRKVIVRLKVPQDHPPAQGSMHISCNPINRSRFVSSAEYHEINDNRVELVVNTPCRFNCTCRGLIGYWFEGYNEQIEPGEGPYEIELDAHPAGAIAGRVLLPNGKPAPDLFIRIQRIDPVYGQHEFQIHDAVETGSQRPSTFNLTPLELGGEYQLVAHRDYTYTASEILAVNEENPLHEIELVLYDEATIEAQLLTPDGQPAAGVPVDLAVRTKGHWFGHTDKTTDDQGRIRFAGINPRAERLNYFIEVGATNEYQPMLVPVQPDQSITIQLKKGMVLEGQVVNAVTGEPIAEAKVAFHPVNHKAIEGIAYWEADGPTDVQGRFRAGSLPDGARLKLNVWTTEGDRTTFHYKNMPTIVAGKDAWVEVKVDPDD